MNMELRSARSRSNTPFLSPGTGEKDVIVTGNHVEKVTKTKSTTITTYDSGWSSDSKHIKSKSKKSQRGMVITSDYSSEDGEHDSSSPSRHISDNLKNQLKEETLYSSSSKPDLTALKIYKEAGEYWNKYPKTDYTYSKHSKDRIELAPGVVAMPNMSRRSLHSFSSNHGGYTLNKQTNTDSYMERHSLDYSSSATNGSHVKQRLFATSNNNQDYDEEEEEFVVIRRSVTRRTVVQSFIQTFLSIVTTIFYPVYFIYRKQHSILLGTAKLLHKLAARVMLFDTWLLQGSDKKLSAILGLCLFPLLLFGGWCLVCGLGQLVQNTFSNGTLFSIEMPSIVSHLHSSLTDLEHEPMHKREVVDEGGAIDELRAKIDMIQGQLTQPESNKQSNLLNIINTIDELKAKIDLIQKEMAQTEQSRKDDLAKLLAELELGRSEDKAEIISKVREENRNSFIDVEQYVFKFLKEIFGTPNYVVDKEDFTRWIQLIFVAQQNLEARLSNLTRNIRNEYITILTDNEKILMDKVTAKILELNVELSKPNKDGEVTSLKFTDEHIKKLVGEALAVYDADKTGLVDFALESAGGHVISTRCTESYQAKTAVLSIFGIPLHYPTNSPRTAITPGTNPGECWAFQNFPGFLVVKLSARISVEAFTLEHISKRLSATGKIDSALKQFEVYGLLNENDPEPVLLGSYEYKENGKPLQYFAAEKRGQIFDMVELRILSNHGNPNYTCLYRFRVHGTITQEPT